MSFWYINSLSSYNEEIEVGGYDDITKNVKSVTFDIGRYGQTKHTIKFKEMVTQNTAIKKIEEFLSKPLTRYWFNKVKKNNDLFPSWDKFESGYCKGDLLGDCKFIESMSVDKNNNLTFECGS